MTTILEKLKTTQKTPAILFAIFATLIFPYIINVWGNAVMDRGDTLLLVDGNILGTSMFLAKLMIVPFMMLSVCFYSFYPVARKLSTIEYSKEDELSYQHYAFLYMLLGGITLAIIGYFTGVEHLYFAGTISAISAPAFGVANFFERHELKGEKAIEVA